MRTTSVNGVQPKFWDGGMLYKQDTPGMHEGATEAIISLALDATTYCGDTISHVHYEMCDVNGVQGCKCPTFLLPGETEAPFVLIKRLTSLCGILNSEHWEPVLLLFLLDAALRNGDRHLSNLSLIQHLDGSCALAPYFDFGNAEISPYPTSIEDFIPEPFGREQLYWAKKLLSKRPVFHVKLFRRPENILLSSMYDSVIDMMLDAEQHGLVEVKV